jgi:phycoerythrin-associated linker protein
MVNFFVNPVLNPDAKLGFNSADQDQPLRLWQHAGDDEVNAVIRAVYRQVLGNTHVMESERLQGPESQLRNGRITVREFVRQMALSDLYRDRLFNCGRMRSIEINFKHLLGRAPDSYEEVLEHTKLLDQHGFEAEINSYIDSDEYAAAFEDNTVPFYRGNRSQVGQSLASFANLSQLPRSPYAYTKGTNSLQLIRAVTQSDGVAKRGTTPTQAIMEQVFKPKPRSSYGVSANDLALRETIKAQAETIATLQQQLADLRPFASLGAGVARSGWQPSAAPDSVEEGGSLFQQDADQQAQIKALNEQIADSRRYAAVGYGRAQKWQNRFRIY